MEILLKYTLKSIGEKKFRSFLIIFAIALAGALALTSTQLADTISNMYMKQLKASYGDVDISITANEDSPSPFISITGCDCILNEAEYIIPSIRTSAEYQSVEGVKSTIQINGYNFEDYKAINKLDLLKGSTKNVTASYPIILSKNGARQLGMEVGDTIKLSMVGGTKRATLVAIADTTGLFINEQGNISGIMPFDTISKAQNSYGKPTKISIKLKAGEDQYEVMETLKAAYPKYDVSEAIDIESFNASISMLTDPLMMLTCIIIFMSMFIIYSSFKVIMLEKLSVIGTFRSIGASIRIMNGVLMLEAAFYGVIGSIMACLLGVGCLYALTSVIITNAVGTVTKISLNIPLRVFLMTLLLSGFMALASTIIPIMSVSKISLKDIILNNRPHKSRKYLKSTCLGGILIAIACVLPELMPKSVEMISASSSFLLIIVGFILILPTFTLIASGGLGVIFRLLFGNIGELATKNIKKNKGVLNSITLISMGISVLLMVSTITTNVSDQILDFFKDTFKCDMIAYIEDSDEQTIRMIKRIEGVKTITKAMNPVMKMEDLDDTTVYPMVIEDTKLMPYIRMGIPNEEELLKQLQEGRNIILTETLKNRYGLKEGDKITVPFEKKRDRTYTIIGFADTIWQDGRFVILPLKYYKQDADVRYYDDVYITVNEGVDPEEVVGEIKKIADHLERWSNIRTIEQITISNQERTASLMTYISSFALLAMLIGIIGVVNNLIISFIERKQSIAMLRSIGMSKRQTLKMIFIEALGAGIIGSVSGILGGILFCKIGNYIMEAMEEVIKVTVEPSLFWKYLIGGILITVMGSIIPAIGNSKLNIIEAVKYE